MKRKRAVTLVLGVCLAMAASASADSVGGATFDFVNITAVGAAADFRMGKYEVTEDQWAAIMGGGGSGLTPKVSITFHQAAAFVNAMNVAAGSTVAYNIIGGVVNPWGGSGVYRDPAATYFMIDENEFSDAYHNGTAFQTYATPSGALPVAGTEANYDGSALWNVGSGAVELNGTFDVMGNAAEFMENDTNWLYPGTAGANHRFMGGAFPFGSYMLPYTFLYAYGAGGASDFVGFRVGSFVTGDFNGDGDVDDLDIDALGDAIRLGWTDARYDITADGTTEGTDGFIDLLDLDYLVRVLVETAIGNGSEYGDFNLDGLIDTTDLTRLATDYGVTGDTWAKGNANRNIDLITDTTDLTILATYYGFGVPDAVPEPMTLSLLALGGLAILRRRKS